MLIKILPSLQQLQLLKHDQIIKSYLISTAKNGLGEQHGSHQTPRGWHVIAEKIGANQPVNTVFIARKPSGEIYSSALQAKFVNRDWILTRILWLAGLELGKNLGANVDSKQRYIYIHGAPDAAPFGTPASKGCIRMQNSELIELFDMVEVGTQVYIADEQED